jgi:hypothetical protein
VPDILSQGGGREYGPWPRRVAAVAAGVPGTLWLTSYPPDADPRTAAGFAREVSVTGRPIGAPVRLPAGYLIEQGTSRGLLLAPAR